MSERARRFWGACTWAMAHKLALTRWCCAMCRRILVVFFPVLRTPEAVPGGQEGAGAVEASRAPVISARATLAESLTGAIRARQSRTALQRLGVRSLRMIATAPVAA